MNNVVDSGLRAKYTVWRRMYQKDIYHTGDAPTCPHNALTTQMHHMFGEIVVCPDCNIPPIQVKYLMSGDYLNPPTA